MVLIETFAMSQDAEEIRNLLRSRGIVTKLCVDPLSSFAPALGAFEGVGVFVQDVQAHEAVRLLRGRLSA